MEKYINKVAGKLRSLKLLYHRYFSSAKKYAKILGVKVGEHTFIDTKFFSTEPYLIEIGNNVQVTSGVRFYTHGGCHAVRNAIPNFDSFGRIKICDNAYIGSCTLIMPGVTIGEGALVAAGSVVTKSIPPYTVYGGNPARYIASIDEYLLKNSKYNMGTKGLNAIQKKTIILQNQDKLIKK